MIILAYKRLENSMQDITHLTGKKSWSGEKQKAPRQLNFDFFKPDGYDLNLGDIIIFQDENGKELFRGFIRRRDFNEKRIRKIVCYDSLYYWTKNRDSFTFKGKTLDGVFLELCKRFDSKYGSFATNPFVIKELIEQMKTPYDVMKNAMKIIYDNTGKRYYLRDNKGAAELIERKKQTHNWVLETGGSICSYSYSESIENLYTKVKLTYEDSKTKQTITVSEQSDDLIKKFGLTQYAEKVSESSNQAQLSKMAKTMLSEKGQIEEKLSIKAWGLDDVISGDSVIVKIPLLDMERLYYVDSDTHEYNGRVKTMSLSLTRKLDD